MKAARTASKTFFFGYLYGQGSTIRGNTLSKNLAIEWHNTTTDGKGIHSFNATKLSDSIKVTFTQEEYDTAAKRIQKRLNEEGLFPLKKDLFVKPTERLIIETIYGEQVANNFLKNLVGIDKLIEHCQTQSKTKGTVTAIDGRELYSRSPHSALNLLLQGSAGVVGKQWMVNYHNIAQAKYKLRPFTHYKQYAYIHDEFECGCRADLAPLLAAALEEGAAQVTEQFNINLPIRADAHIGPNWAEVH